jgi:hypothetical protein
LFPLSFQPLLYSILRSTSSVTRRPNQLTSLAEAENIYKNGGKAVQSLGNGGRQTGSGVYILNKFQDYENNDPEGKVQWDCVVTVDAEEWDKWTKVYVPELFTFLEDVDDETKDTCKPLELWKMRPAMGTCSIPSYPFGFAVDTDASDTAVKNRQRFIEYVSPGATIKNTVIFSKLKGKLQTTQGMLPPALIDTGKVHLAQCAERGTEANQQIGKMGTADWGFVESLPDYGMGAYA